MQTPDPAAVRAFLEDRHVELAAGIAEFGAREIGTLAEPADDGAARAQARHILEVLGRADWFAPIGDQDLRACCLIREALAAASPLADAVFALQALGSLPIVLAGTAQVKQRWLPAVRAGRAMAAFAMTEPDAGSDVASLATTARRDGSDYILLGTKTLISNAGIADFYTVFASTDAARGRRGISCFVVPADAPGLRYVGPQVLSAPHPLGEIAFTDCRVPAACRVGDEGEGYRLGLATLDRLRAGGGGGGGGGAGGGGGGATRVTLEAAMAKAFATEAAQRIVDAGVQILGGRGVLASHPVDRLYRSVRALRIYEGTTEIQHLIVAGQLIRAAEAARTAAAEAAGSNP